MEDKVSDEEISILKVMHNLAPDKDILVSVLQPFRLKFLIGFIVISFEKMKALHAK